jgi:hypothetical protein
MVSNIPHSLRTDKELKDYFEYYMSRPLDKPSMGLTSSTQPGLLNKSFSFFFNRAKHVFHPTSPTSGENNEGDAEKSGPSTSSQDGPIVVRVAIARKMTELASLLERRADVLRHL